MSPRTRNLLGVVRAVPFCLALGVAGCSMDEVQFNGGIFDAVGLSDYAKSKGSEPQLAARAPLVVPPSLDRLPQPGSGQQEDQLAGIKDPDIAKKASQAELERQQAEYCKVNYEDALTHGDESTAINATGPLGPCRQSVLSSIKKWNKSE